jgi:hypothetical protein
MAKSPNGVPKMLQKLPLSNKSAQKMNKRKFILFSVAACFVVLAIAGTIAYSQDLMFCESLQTWRWRN